MLELQGSFDSTEICDKVSYFVPAKLMLKLLPESFATNCRDLSIRMAFDKFAELRTQNCVNAFKGDPWAIITRKCHITNHRLSKD